MTSVHHFLLRHVVLPLGMFLLWMRVYTLFSTRSPPACAAEDGTVTLGVHLGLTHFSAACLSKDKTPIPVVRVEGQGTYHAYMNDTADNYDFRLQWLVYDNQRWMKVDGKDVPAPPEEHNDTSAREILTGALHKVVLAAQRSLHKKVKIGILSYPDHWNSTSRLSAFNAAKEVDTSYGEPWQLRRFFQVVASAYSDAYCTSLLTSVAPDDEPLEWILIINQELNRVETFVGSIDSVGPYLEGKSTVVLDEPITEDAASLEGNQQVRESWLSVVEQHLPSWTSRSSSDLETVIIAGELSPNTARITAKAISNILDISPDKVVIDHSPYRAALGAACHAYRMKIYQPRPIEDCSIPSSLPPELMVKSQDLERLVESMRISLPSSVQLQN